MIIAQVTHFHKLRLKNLPEIVRSLSTQVDKTIIYNQDEPFDGILTMTDVIQAEKNYGAQGIFIGAQLLPTSTHVLFHDNDLVLSKNAVRSLKTIADQNPGAIIVGTSERHVYEGQTIVCTQNKIELVPRPLLNRILDGWEYDEHAIHHDIWYSVRAHQLGIPIIPIHVGWKNFYDNVGLWNTNMPKGKRRMAFFHEREEYFQYLMRNGA